jgi:hypothetical protein
MLLSQVNWGDCTLRHRLKQAVPDHIKDSLMLVEEPVAFNEWKCLVQNVDQWYWERQAEIHQDACLNPGTNTSCGTPAPNTRNAVSGAPTTSATSVARGPPSNPPIACHLTMQGGLTQTEQDNGLCRVCAYTVEDRDTRPVNVVRCGSQGKRREGQCNSPRQHWCPSALVPCLSNQTSL